MKKTICLLLLVLFASTISYTQKKDVSSFDGEFLNWFNKDISADKANGSSVYKTYEELIKGSAPKKKIIVAVIDAGIDPLHEDLKQNMWVNQDEIPGNNIDDDKNGYVDDIYGWNFLGNSKGKNIDAENLESTRILKNLQKKYQDVSDSGVKEEDKKEYELYKKLDKLYWDNRNKYSQEFKQANELKTTFDFLYQFLETETKLELNSLEDIESIESENPKVLEFKKVLLKAEKDGLTRKEIDGYYKHASKAYTAYYNVNFTPRKKIIGDDITDITDNKYGNGDVKGEDAFHGTFCAGIIGAVQDNKTGIDGIASKIEIMAIRAVPNGDEYDKDIALSIRYAVDNGAQIINMSFGKDYSPQKNLVDDAIKYAEEKGVLLVHAAGNDAKNIDLGENFPTDSLDSGSFATNVITVGASSISNKKKMPASFSNYGKKHVDLFAPGVDIVSLAPDNTYDIGDGTSFAAPVVTGVAALIWSYYPELTYLELKEILMESATNYEKKKVLTPSEGKKKGKTRFSELSVSGGIVNAYAAFNLAKNYK